ncbi:MAG: GNAT family N-acetyltransferase [Chloroflexota bacterium]|nr:MAG: GNAT family N-acetyltransferase [Chloroflexota bacterium]
MTTVTATSSRATIRPMSPADVDPATAAILAADWGDRRTWFEFATSQPECRPVVAEIDGRLVGTGVGTANGRVGWVGTIWVDPGHRGSGLGRALTQTVIDGLDAAGCRTLVLVATDQGLPLYERMGFRLQTRYRILEAPGLGTAAPRSDSHVRAFAPADLAAIIDLDRTATGEDREHAIRRFATPETAKVLEVAGDVRGFVIRAPWGGGATIAPEIADAMRILDARRRASGPGGRVRVGLVEENVAGLAALQAAGLAPIWSAPRLARGDPLDWHPDWIWGQFNHAMG